MDTINNILIYINYIIHTQDHLGILDQTLQRLNQHGLKINLIKCYLGNKVGAYLGFKLTREGLPGREKIQHLQKFDLPKDLQQVQELIGHWTLQFLPGTYQEFRQISEISHTKHICN